MPLQQIAKDTCIVRNTAGQRGRTLAIEPGSTASRYLHYGRIILDQGDAPIHVDTNALETGLAQAVRNYLAAIALGAAAGSAQR